MMTEALDVMSNLLSELAAAGHDRAAYRRFAVPDCGVPALHALTIGILGTIRGTRAVARAPRVRGRPSTWRCRSMTA